MTKSFSYKTIDPKNPTGPRIEVTIPSELILRFFKYETVRYEQFRCVEEVLESPKRIFSGCRRISEGFWCYVGRPKTWFIDESTEVPFSENKVFAVYFNSRMIMYEFRAEVADLEDKLSPKDWKNRFGGLVWKGIS